MSDIDEAGLVARITKQVTAALRGRGSGESAESGDREGQAVPYYRFAKTLDRAKAAEAALEEVQAGVVELQTGYASQLKSIQETAAADVARIGGQHAEDIGLIDSGMTDKAGRSTLRRVWEDLPKEGRGETPGDYWKSVMEQQAAHTADPKKNDPPAVARPLTSYLQPVEAVKSAPARRDSPSSPDPVTVKGLAGVPVDQGMDAFMAGLRGLPSEG